MKKFFLLCMMFAVTSAFAQEVEQKEAPKGKASSELSALRLAGDLVEYGYAQQDVYPLIQALRIMSNTPTQALDAEKKVGEATKAADGTKQSQISFEFAQLLADAKELAQGDAVATQMIADIESVKGGHRGAVGGPKEGSGRVEAYSYETWDVNFRADCLGEVVVIGDSDTDLDVYLYDSNGNLIDSDTDYTDRCYVSCWPRWTGRFTIKVVNRGGVYNRYVILTN